MPLRLVPNRRALRELLERTVPSCGTVLDCPEPQQKVTSWRWSSISLVALVFLNSHREFYLYGGGKVALYGEIK